MPATVIVVDENRTFVNQLAAILSEAGHAARGVVGRAEAVRTFERLPEPPDLAIIDFFVPGTTGPELIGTVKLRMPETLVIATVPAEGPDLSELAARTGADLVLHRAKEGEPPDAARWKREVAELLEKRRR